MQLQTQSLTRSLPAGLASNKVIRNTYILLSATLLFSAFVAGVSTYLNVTGINMWVFLIGAYGLMFLTHKFQNSSIGILCVFAFTGFLGYTLGPVINMALSVPNGSESVAMALGLTGIIFLGLSGYALTTRKDFSFLGGFMLAGFLVLAGTMILGFFTNIPGLQLAISAGFVLFSSAAILYQTSQMIHDPDANYIMMTIGLFVQIYNLFLSLLHLIMAFRGD